MDLHSNAKDAVEKWQKLIDENSEVNTSAVSNLGELTIIDELFKAKN